MCGHVEAGREALTGGGSELGLFYERKSLSCCEHGFCKAAGGGGVKVGLDRLLLKQDCALWN